MPEIQLYVPYCRHCRRLQRWGVKPPKPKIRQQPCSDASSAKEPVAALIFHSPNHLSPDGVHYQDMLIPGTIRVSDGYGFVDYYYQTDGRQLVAVYPDGSQIYCVRSDCSSLVTTGNQSTGSASGGHASGSYNNEFVTPSFGGGSWEWETEGDCQYYDDSAGYGGGAYENPTSNYYDYK